MKKLLLMLMFSAPIYAETYSDCIISNMEGINSDVAARLIRVACREKALPYIPEKCKSLVSRTNLFAKVESETKEDCISSCLEASFVSKHFGECKK